MSQAHERQPQQARQLYRELFEDTPQKRIMGDRVDKALSLPDQSGREKALVTIVRQYGRLANQGRDVVSYDIEARNTLDLISQNGLSRLNHLEALSSLAAIRDDKELARRACALADDSEWARRTAAQEFTPDTAIFELTKRPKELRTEAKLVVGKELGDGRLIDEAYTVNGKRTPPHLLLRLAEAGHVQAYKDLKSLLEDTLPEMPNDSSWRQDVEKNVLPGFAQLEKHISSNT